MLDLIYNQKRSNVYVFSGEGSDLLIQSAQAPPTLTHTLLNYLLAAISLENYTSPKKNWHKQWAFKLFSLPTRLLTALLPSYLIFSIIIYRSPPLFRAISFFNGLLLLSVPLISLKIGYWLFNYIGFV